MTGSGGSSGSSLAEEVDGAQRDAACLLSSAQPMAPLPCYLLLPNSSPASSLPPPPMPLSCRTSAILLPPGHQQPEEFNLNFDHLAENSLAGVYHRSPASSLACCLPHIWAVDYIPLHHYHPTQYPPTISANSQRWFHFFHIATSWITSSGVASYSPTLHLHLLKNRFVGILTMIPRKHLPNLKKKI